MKILHFLTVILLSSTTVLAQDSLITKIASEHEQIISFDSHQFSGEGIKTFTQKIAQHRYVLIGEDHLNNEVLDFTSYLTQNIDFDNYITEADQLTMDILRKDYNKVKEYRSIVTNSKDKFSFFSFDRDRELLNSFFKNNKTTIGLDNVFFNSDSVVFQELINKTSNKQAKAKYEAMLQESLARWNRYKANPDQQPSVESNQPYLFTSDFGKKIMDIQKLKLSEYEYQALNSLLKSNRIYNLGYTGDGLESHYMRISSMKAQLLKNLDKIKGKRNLFKFGANHVGKGRSLFQNSFDVGNLVTNLADAEQEQSLHIAIIQQGGKAGSFFSESSEADNVSFLKPFYKLIGKDNEWLLFDLNKINENIKKQKTVIKSTGLKNLIEGYDYLIIIPKVTAQKIVTA
ncbi:hypothetical protein [Chryseobacterium sp.]|uniref:hypothetical protein n=1 Tax=Chryseobacterium sp. TaxID=1871047 RepID=UPI002635D679|nr:hypothetical protein [Chryseobacterium sp.]